MDKCNLWFLRYLHFCLWSIVYEKFRNCLSFWSRETPPVLIWFNLMPDRGIKPYCTYNVLNTQRFATDLWFFRLNLCWIWDQIGWNLLDGIIHLPCMIRAFSRAFTKGLKSPIADSWCAKILNIHTQSYEIMQNQF